MLDAHGSYVPARASFSDDVTLARHLAAEGARVGFLDGSRVIQVRAYDGLREMWREWGRSFDLKDATSRARGWMDVLLVWLVQALPLPVLVLMALCTGGHVWSANAWPDMPRWLQVALLTVNGTALLVRLSMLSALRGSYAVRGIAYWCSWLADGAAAYRLTLSMVRTPTAWRGRRYPPLGIRRERPAYRYLVDAPVVAAARQSMTHHAQHVCSY